jgi:hypothetical protein
MANLYAPLIVNPQRNANTVVQASTLESAGGTLQEMFDLQAFRTVKGRVSFPSYNGAALSSTNVVLNEYDGSPLSFNPGDVIVSATIANGSPAQIIDINSQSYPNPFTGLLTDSGTVTASALTVTSTGNLLVTITSGDILSINNKLCKVNVVSSGTIGTPLSVTISGIEVTGTFPFSSCVKYGTSTVLAATGSVDITAEGVITSTGNLSVNVIPGSILAIGVSPVRGYIVVSVTNGTSGAPLNAVVYPPVAQTTVNYANCFIVENITNTVIFELAQVPTYNPASGVWSPNVDGTPVPLCLDFPLPTLGAPIPASPTPCSIPLVYNNAIGSANNAGSSSYSGEYRWLNCVANELENTETMPVQVPSLNVTFLVLNAAIAK